MMMMTLFPLKMTTMMTSTTRIVTKVPTPSGAKVANFNSSNSRHDDDEDSNDNNDSGEDIIMMMRRIMTKKKLPSQLLKPTLKIHSLSA